MGTVETISGAVIVGAIIGALFRLIMRDRHSVGSITMIVLGALGGLAGSGIAILSSYKIDSSGIVWIPFFIGIAVAIWFISIYVRIARRRIRTTPRPLLEDDRIGEPVYVGVTPAPLTEEQQ